MSNASASPRQQRPEPLMDRVLLVAPGLEQARHVQRMLRCLGPMDFVLMTQQTWRPDEAERWQPDLMVVWEGVQGIGGGELLERVGESLGFQMVPLVVVPVQANAEQQARWLRQGVDGVLPMPLEAGQVGCVCAPLLRLRRTMKRMQAQLTQAQTRADRQDRRVVWGHKALRERLPEELDRTARHGGPLGLLWLKLHGLDVVGQTYGARIRDRLVKAAVVQACKAMGPADWCTVLPGGELVIVLPSTAEDTQQTVGRQVASAVRSVRLMIEGHQVGCGVQLRQVAWNGAETTDELLERLAGGLAGVG